MIKMERLLKTSTSALLATAFLLQGCGSNSGIGANLVRSLAVTSTPNGQDVLVTVSTELNAGNLIFPAVNLPIVDPKNPTRPYGTLTLQRTLEGKNMLTASINVTKLAGGEGLVAPNLLPNGNQIPVAGVKDVVALQAGSSSRVYLGLNESSKMLGFAVAIKEFDSIAKYVPGANLFFDLPQTNGIRGLAGIFTGIESGTSGFGIFIDATQALDKLQMAAVPNKVIGMSAVSAKSTASPVMSKSSRGIRADQLKSFASDAAASAKVSSEIRFISGSNLSGEQQQQLQVRAYNLSRQKRRVNVVND